MRKGRLVKPYEWSPFPNTGGRTVSNPTLSAALLSLRLRKDCSENRTVSVYHHLLRIVKFRRQQPLCSIDGDRRSSVFATLSVLVAFNLLDKEVGFYKS